MNIILFQPEIPQNTGNIIRTCKVTNTKLTLVRPLGFSTSSRALKRAGLDYWEGVDVQFIDDLYAFLHNTDRDFYFFSSHAQKKFTDIEYSDDCYLIFGSETSGLPKIYHETWSDKFATIPMVSSERCLNLSNSVAIAVYEVARQQNFSSFQKLTV